MTKFNRVPPTLKVQYGDLFALSLGSLLLWVFAPDAFTIGYAFGCAISCSVLVVLDLKRMGG